MLFSELVAGLVPEGDGWSVTVPDTWAQGRALFGGLQTGLMLRAMRKTLGTTAPLRSMQVTFMAPVPAGKVHITVQVLRAGKSATHVESRIRNGSELAAVVVGVFGAARESVVKVDLPCPPPDKTPEQCAQMPYLPGIVPVFLQHTQMRWARGAAPFSGVAATSAQIHLRFVNDPVVTEETLLGLADIIPPLGLSFLKKPAPGSSMTWTLDLLRHDWPQGNEFWRVDAELTSAREGYSSQTATLFSPDGKAIALSRQAMVVFG